jgi:tetratricopeptide repeat protein 21B
MLILSIILFFSHGYIYEMQKFFSSCEAKLGVLSDTPGLHYCRGWFYRLTGNAQKALTELNQARTDPKWGVKAKMHMLRLYVGFDQDILGDDEEKGKEEKNHTNAISAKELIIELASRLSKEEISVYSQYPLILTREKQSIEKAVSTLIPLTGDSAHNCHPSALIALATAHIFLKQIPKARNYLKRLESLPFKQETQEEFERGRVLLAQIHIQSTKLDLAQTCLENVLEKNKSNVKAWELFGHINEKEQMYRDAAEKYEKAWEILNKSDATIGFKLAFNFLKAKKYVEAVDVCNRILSLYPNYPRIKQEILEKARIGIKP